MFKEYLKEYFLCVSLMKVNNVLNKSAVENAFPQESSRN